ncbi:uncharacterized protein LOC100828324 [Brachypodium distachyon]|uniref:Uncharacterized protein n=1 Tax=Brachypodium distachyon TaxID=15368 RepID=I1IR76_BRADI|nr:uncharacterized protein LOC100828324 [Brachypodium distachyon]KQJ90732.1 hypothetical protein BRADI_4g33570v3 [Brachypodium distachyon]|eukprot:XP_003576671.1 uncharacterized protein LOC100828324 [Brachypodium distachyon]
MASSSSPTPALLSAPTSLLPPHSPSHRNAVAAAWPNRAQIRLRATTGDHDAAAAATTTEEDMAKRKQRKRCLRCGALYLDVDNSPAACAFHGHITGEKGLFSLSPPHQGIDGEWSDKSGVIVYRWNDRGSRPNTGRANWKGRWSCCQERDEDAPPCRRGCHVSYDDGFTLF